MNSAPTVTGLVLNYRDAERTRRSVSSLLSQDIAQILVWDNSEDAGLSATALMQMFENEPRVSVQISESNLGFASGVNRGVQFLRSRFPSAWILLLNNDACLLPGAIPRLTEALIHKPTAAIAYPDIDHAGKVLGTVYYHRLCGLLGQAHLPGSFPYASGCCQLVAPERFDGPVFDEDFFMYGEDWLQGWTLGAEGMAHVSQTLVYHEGSQSSGMGSTFYETRINAAHWMLAKKIARDRLDFRLLQLGRHLTLLSRAILRSLRFRKLTPIKAYSQGKSLAAGAGRTRGVTDR